MIRTDKASKKKSMIWKYFVIYEMDKKLAVCLLCNRKISRGGEGKKAGTTSMNNHLKNKHTEMYISLTAKATDDEKDVTVDILPDNSATGEPSDITMLLEKPTELALDTTSTSRKGNDSKAKIFPYLLAEMVALDNTPYEIVERIGFQRLFNKVLPNFKVPSASYIASKIVPDIYNRIRTRIVAKISKALAISVTSDIQTCRHETETFLVLFAHWLSPEYDFERVLLTVKPFEKIHTAENIAEELKETVKRWNISHVKVNLLLHNSEATVLKNSRFSEYDTVPCFVHTIKNIIDKSLTVQVDVIEIISIAKGIVKHFKDCKIKDQLSTLHRELNLPDGLLVPDAKTENSIYNLLEYLLKYKQYISTYVTHYKFVKNLIPSQWDLLQQCVNLLNPFEEVIKITSSDPSPISEVIPHVVTLIKYLGKDETATRTPDLKAIQSQLKAELESHFDFDKNDYEKHFLATFFDPRFKTNFFTVDQTERTIRKIILEGIKISSDESRVGAYSPPIKKRVTNDNTLEESCSFWKCFDEIANSDVPGDEKSSVVNEIDYYLKTIPLDRKANSFKWWLANAAQYPILSTLVKIYRSTPCNNLYNKKLFSDAAIKYEEKCNLLHASNVDELVFIHHNLPLVDFNY